jgi:hypothetical protein
VRRFIDRDAEFLFVPKDKVFAVAKETGAIPYDIPGAKLSHVGETCSFDTFISEYGLKDAALDRVAVIVRGADTSRLDLAPEAAGLLAVSLGLSRNYPDDHAMLEAGMLVYDALYAWAKWASNEAHGWPPQA